MKPLNPDIDDETTEMNIEDLAEIEVSTLLSKEVRRLQSQTRPQKDATEATSKQAKEYLAQATSELISTTRTLRQLGTWQSVPGFCETASLHFDVRNMKEHLEKESVSP